MSEVLYAFGRGVVKTLVSTFVGVGVGLLTFGLNIEESAEVWHRGYPPSAVFVAVGAGMLTAGGLMFVLFVTPRLFSWVPPASVAGKGDPLEL